MAGAGRRGEPWKRFRAARWYPAEWVDGEGGEVRLTDGSASAVWPRGDVEIRAAPDDAWDVRALSRLSENRDGQTPRDSRSARKATSARSRPASTRRWSS